MHADFDSRCPTVSRLVRNLIQRHRARPSQFHLLGHSLGAHISGYAARNVTGLGRVTGTVFPDPLMQQCPRPTKTYFVNSTIRPPQTWQHFDSLCPPLDPAYLRGSLRRPYKQNYPQYSRTKSYERYGGKHLHYKEMNLYYGQTS